MHPFVVTVEQMRQSLEGWRRPLVLGVCDFAKGRSQRYDGLVKERS
jgi:hypothetical protein